MINQTQSYLIYKKILFDRKDLCASIKLTDHPSLFNLCLTTNKELNNFYFNINTYNINSINVLPADLLIVNNPIDFSHNTNDYKEFCNKIIFFHESIIQNLKKEDKYILGSRLGKYKKYTFVDQSSGIEGISRINYGFRSQLSNTTRNKNLLIIQDGNQSINSSVFEELKKIIPETDMLDPSVLTSQEALFKKLSMYKVCLSPHSVYNSLLAASCGCFVVSLTKIEDIPYHSKIQNLEELIFTIKDLRDKHNNTYEQIISNEITTKYPYEKFIDSMKNIFTSTIKEPVLL
jgi:hypothetical protein